MKLNKFINIAVLAGLVSNVAYGAEFKLHSNDITDGQFLSQSHEYNGFGCSGENKSPQLSWSGAPNGTEAYAIMVYDPDAPTGSGWWHWQVVNIPKNVTSVPSGNGVINYPGVIINKNDYGEQGFGGACPPAGNEAHRYQFTVYALSKKLELPNNPSGALVGYMVKANSLASSTIETLYKK